MLRVVEHDPSWARAFERLHAELWPRVDAIAIAIEHVGSTAVPGLAAKPILDVDVVVRVPDDSAAAIRALEAIGYRHCGDLGIAGREAMASPAGATRQNLYVCLASSEAYRNHIQLRDLLRSSAAAARAYGRLKRELADRFPDDPAAYTEGKTSFIVGLLRDAGFDAAALARIEAANRR